MRETICGIVAAIGQPCEDPAPPPIPVDVAGEAATLCASVALPEIVLRANPRLGLVNVPTWFWVENYDGGDLADSQSWGPPYVPTTIEVRLTVSTLRWNFGDGGQRETRSLGQAYPRESDVQNTYRWSSRGEPGGHFAFALTVEWLGEYRVNGGAWTAITTITRRYEGQIAVQQSQPIIVR